MMYLVEKWVFILFCWGGIGIAGWWLRSLARFHGEIEIERETLKSAIAYLMLFVLAATFAMLDLFRFLFGSVLLQSVSNLIAGVLFVVFLLKLKSSLREKPIANRKDDEG